jgi:hypothetical protein
MSLLDTLIGIFSDNSEHEQFSSDPEGYLNQVGLGNVTSQDIEAEMPRVLNALQGNEGGATQGGAASFAGSGNVVLPPPPAGGYEGGYEGGGLSGAIESINHYTNVINNTEQYFQDNDTTNIDDRDTTVDQSVNQNITAFGDVNQDFDNDVVSGDHAAAAGDGSQVNTGDGAVQAGDDIEDSTIATGDVGGSVFDDATDSVIGDDNQVISNSDVGAASFGSGDATNVEAENANLGDGVIVDDTNGDVNLNTGEGDFTQISDSSFNESVVGDGSVESERHHPGRRRRLLGRLRRRGLVQRRDAGRRHRREHRDHPGGRRRHPDRRDRQLDQRLLQQHGLVQHGHRADGQLDRRQLRHRGLLQPRRQRDRQQHRRAGQRHDHRRGSSLRSPLVAPAFPRRGHHLYERSPGNGAGASPRPGPGVPGANPRIPSSSPRGDPRCAGPRAVVRCTQGLPSGRGYEHRECPR